jgi:hypothetical protein
MEIKANSSVGAVPPGAVPTAPRVRRVDQEAGDFTGTEALERAMAQTPDVRPEAVARGRALLVLDDYPPPDVLRPLAVAFAAAFGHTGVAGEAGAEPQ